MRTMVWFCVVALLTSGCAHFRIAPEGTPPSTSPQSRRVHALLWGALEPRTTPDNCNGYGLSAVTVKVTTIDAIATKQKMTYDEAAAKRIATIPAKRFGDANELGALCAFLCSTHAGFMTGQSLLIDGGAYPGTF